MAPLRGRVLIADDEPNIRRMLSLILRSEGAEVVEAEDGEAAWQQLLAHGDTLDAVIMDVLMPKRTGIEVLELLQQRVGRDAVPVIMVSGHASLEDAARATRLGAYDFFEKPLDRTRVLVSVRNALRQRASERALQRAGRRALDAILGSGPAHAGLRAHIEKVGPTRARVLITGESGTGKELVARAIHETSARAEQPFVRVNCAAIAPELIESELFGHEKGAFTGATSAKVGLFEAAHGGSILLDEIGDMAAAAQAKVLRVLQNGEILSVGGSAPRRVDVRVIAATHQDLQARVHAGTFRADLLYRLAVVPIHVPPLRERREDIPHMVAEFVREACHDNGFAHKRVHPSVLATLVAYDWPGNVRQLKNVVERMVILSESEIGPHDVPSELFEASMVPMRAADAHTLTLRAFREQSERALIEARLEACAWNISRCAASLGVERTHLHRKLRAFGLSREGEGRS